MNSRWKKVISLFLALSIVCSLAVIPAGAAGEDLAVSFENGSWSGQTYTVDVAAKGTGSFASAGYTVKIGFDKNVLAFVKAADKTGIGGGGNFTATDAAKANQDGVLAIVNAAAAAKSFTAAMPIATLTFQLKDNTIENQDTALTFTDETVINNDSNGEFTISKVGGTVTITNGAAPTLASVGHNAQGSSITVNGGAESVSVKATAKSTKDADISTSVTWTVSPADGGVTVGEDGTVTVSPTAKAGSYQITATPISGKCQGAAQSTSISVIRAAAAASSIAVFQNGAEITGDAATIIKPTAGKTNTYTYTAEVKDQYGDPFEGTVTWTSGTAPTGVTVAGNVVTVTDSVDVGATLTLTAATGTLSKAITLTVRDINITWPTPAVKPNATYGDSWSQIVTLSGGSAELNGTKVDGTFSVKGESEHPGAGEQPYVIDFKSTDGQYDVDSDAKTATIAKLAVTIKMNDHKAAYGDTFKYYQFDTVITGKPLLFSDTVTATASGDAKGDGTDAVGTYKIHGSATHANYAITVTDGTLTIEKKGVNPAETLPSLTIVGSVKTETDPDTGRTIITGSIKASASEARSLTALLEAIRERNQEGMVPGETTFTLVVGENTATFTFKRWNLAPGQTFEGPGRYEIIPEWECDNAEIAANYEPNLPKLFVDVEGETETLSVNGGKTWKLYISDIEKAGRLNDLLPSHAYYSDGTKVSITGWTYSDGTSVTLSNLLRKAKNGDSITLYPVVSPSYLDVQSLNVRFYNDPGNSGGTSGNGNGNGTGGNISFTIDPEQIFLNFDLPKDVSRSYWAAPYIAWAYQRGVMNGTGNGNFTPNGLTNRQQLWMVLARLSGEKPVNMAAARAWAMSNGISDGTNPGGSLTRQQLVAMLYRYAQMRGCDLTASGELGNYNDARNVSSYARQAMAWAVGNGIVTGTADLRLNPQGTATRSHFAAMMFRFCVKYNV